jgi:arginyl-tRNA synthetase
MIRDFIADAVTQAIHNAQTAGDLPPFEIPLFTVDHPRQAEMGDYAVSVAMQLARATRMAPQKIAQMIVRYLTNDERRTTDTLFVAEVVGGFINFRLTPRFLSSQVEKVLSAGERWGNVEIGKGQKAQVEHGSANPTGYATIGTGRNVIVGDTLANTLDAAGYDVHREWYVNDAGSQVKKLGRSVFARYAQALGADEPLPSDGYQGEDIEEVGATIAKEHGDVFLSLQKDDAAKALGELGIEYVMRNIKTTLARIDIRYDNFFSEKSLWTSGAANDLIERLREKGMIVEHDGAQWFTEDGSPIRSGQGKKRASEEYANNPTHRNIDEDSADENEKGKKLPVQAVVVRSAKVIADPAERGTYFASDIPYAWNKVALRGFNPAVYVWGEDHQADVPRVYAAARALGLSDSAVRIIVYRFITLMQSGQEVRMGKRKGNALRIDDVVDLIGADAFRFVMLSRSIDTKFTFDIDVLKEQNDKNPVYYVQYGHARICSIERKAEEEKWLSSNDLRHASQVVRQYDHPSELALIRKILELPEIVELVAMTLQPHHFTTYAREVAGAFSKFYEDCRIKGTDAEIAFSRLQLARAARLTLWRVLRLMGMSAPERM